MFRTLVCCISLLLVSGAAMGEETEKKSDKLISGMSIVGDQESPKSLAIVPWKSSDLGDPLAVSRSLDDVRQPVDKEVFMRELDYYQIGAESRGTNRSGGR
jgi:hypothetical protein